MAPLRLAVVASVLAAGCNTVLGLDPVTLGGAGGGGSGGGGAGAGGGGAGGGGAGGGGAGGAEARPWIVVFGGYANGVVDADPTVWVAEIQADGHLSEWQQKGNMTGPAGLMGVASSGSAGLAVGGLASGQSVAHVRVARRESDTVTWSQGTALPTGRWGVGLVQHGVRFFALGGRTDDGTATLSEYAYADWTGAVPTTWVPGGLLDDTGGSFAYEGGAAFAYGTALLLAGGAVGPGGGPAPTDAVRTATLSGDMIVGGWTSELPIPTGPAQLPCSFTADQRAFVAGGFDFGTGARDEIHSADLSAAPVAWVYGGELPLSLEGSACVAYGGRVYVIGGSHLPPAGTALVWSAQLNGSQVVNFGAEPSLPANRWAHGAMLLLPPT